MVLRKLSQSFKITIALMLSVFSSGILQVTPVHASTLLPVWCQDTGNHWSAQQGTGDNTQRFPLMGEFSDEYGVVTSETLSQYPTATIGQTLWSDSGRMPNTLDQGCEDQYASVTPTAPTVKVDPCGTSNDMYTIPATTGVIYKVGGVTKVAGDYSTGGALSVTVTAVADTGYTLEGTVSWTLTFTDTACITVIGVPETPSITDLCGEGNAIWDIPADTTDFNWELTQDGHLTVTILTANTTFASGATMYDYGVATEENVDACITEIDMPATPDVTDLCGTGNATWNLPADTTDLNWELTQDGHLTVTILTANTTFTDGMTSHDYGVAVETNTGACPVNDKKIEICHATSAVVNPYNKIPVSVNAADGITGNSGGQADHYGEHTGAIFDPAVNKNGDDWGDIIPPITGVHTGLNWTAQGQAIYNNGDCVYVPPTDMCPAVPGVQTDTTLCPPGQGGGQTLGDSTTKPQTLGTSTELPASLPATGGEASPMLILLASIMAYGVAYFLQGRRQLGQNRA